ncbi:amino acid permease [bacterium]|nr:amino acid permease [bacterium]
MAKLVRTLTLWDLTILVVCSVIGSGIFLVPGVVLKQVDGSLILAMLVWVFGGLLSLVGGLAYGELSAFRPEAGGLYVYIRDCFGPLAAFLFGWTTFFVIGSGSTATLAVAFPAYLGQIIPLDHLMSKLISIGTIIVLTVINVRGVRQSADLQNWTTIIKAAAIILMSVILFWLGKGYQNLSGPDLWPTNFSASHLSAFGIAMISVLWAYEGWQYATYNAGEVIEPQRNFPRAFLIGLLTLISLYLLANFAYIAALGVKGSTGMEAIAAKSISAVIGPGASKLLSLAILVSIFSAENSTILTSPRVFYAMAEDRLFFRKLSEVHPKFHTPAFAIISMGVWSAILAATGTFQQLLTYVIFAGWIFYGLGGACVFVYRKRNPGLKLPYSTPGYPLTPILFVLASAALVINTIAADTRSALVGIGIVLTGVPAYLIWRKGSTVKR